MLNKFFQRFFGNEICFVTGLARSGTTLLQGLPERNEEVLPECMLITQHVIDYKRKQGIDNYKIKVFIPDDDVLRRTYQTDILNLVRNLNKKNVVFKALHLSCHLIALNALFPEKKIYVTLRNVWDVFHSIKAVRTKQNEDSSFEPIYEYMFPFCEGIVAFHKNRIEKKQRTHFILYEELVTDTALTLQKISSQASYRIKNKYWKFRGKAIDLFYSKLYGQPISADSLYAGEKNLSSEACSRLLDVFI